MSSEPALLPDRVYLIIKRKPAIRVKLCTVCNEVEPLDEITCHGGGKTTEEQLGVHMAEHGCSTDFQAKISSPGRTSNNRKWEIKIQVGYK